MRSSRRVFIGYAGAAGVVATSRMPALASAGDTIGVALIGCGRQGRSVAAGMKELPGVRIAAVCD